MDVVAIAGTAAAGTVVLQMLDRPGPNSFVSLRWGPWVALAGALLIVGASRFGARGKAAGRRRPRDWTAPAAPPRRGRRRRRARLRAVLAGRPIAAASQFWAPPMPCMRSVIVGGFSMICEKRTTVTVSSSVTSLP